MKRCKNCALLIFLLAIFVFSPVSCQDAKADDEDSIDLTPPEDVATGKTEDDRGPDPIVGQSLIPPVLGQGLMPGPLNLFSGVFPALNSLLLWSNMFPMSSLLGQPLLGAPQPGAGLFPQIGDLVPSASKVVLVLAEDRNPHAAMKAANQEAARTIRQSDMLSQLLAQISQADLGQMLSQSLDPTQQQNPGQMLQQMLPADLSQSMNQLLSQVLQPLPGLDLSQLPLLGQVLGQAAPAAEPTVGQAADTASEGADAAATAADAAAPSAQQFPFTNLQSAIDAGTQLLGQALQQQNPDFNSVFQLPNLQQAFDASSQMLGQAFQQANDPSSGGFSLPNIQAMIDSSSQMLSQSGGLFNMLPTQSLEPATSASDAEPAASDISEVRVKPDAIPSTVPHASPQQMPTSVHSPTTYQTATTENMDELKMMTALHKALAQKKLPILWFRAATDPSRKDNEFAMDQNMSTKPKTVEESQMEAKIQAFQREVIRELRLLQDIERQAKAMRAASNGFSDKTFKDPMSPYTNTLSKIPVHKITRADIEKALKDEYVRKLLQKTAIGQMKERMAFQHMQQPESTHMKRQAMHSTSTMTPRQMSREDIIRLLAYAYRIANANGLRAFEASGTKSTKINDGKARGSIKDNAKPMMERQMMNTEKKLMNDCTQVTQTPQTNEQSTKMMPESRQMLEKMRDTMARQWATDPNAPKPTAARQSMQQQMPMPYAQSFNQNPQMMPQSRQMADKMQPNLQMPVQQPQQHFDTQSEGKPRQNMPSCAAQTMTQEGRQWAEQQTQNAMQQAHMMMQQEQPLNIMHEPTQMARQQEQPAVMQQPTQMDMQEPQKTMPETQIVMQQPRTEEMQQGAPDMPEMTADKQERTPDMHGPLLLGEATPQMPDTTGKARQKDDGWSKWGGWGSGWGGPGWGGAGWLGWHGKNKYGGWPTIVNYYYNPGRAYHREGHDHTTSTAPGYGSGSSNSHSHTNYGSSNSGGYSAPSSITYRTAVGDEEIQAMLEEHARQNMMTDPTTNTACEPQTIPQQATTTTTDIDERSEQQTDELAKEKEIFMDTDKKSQKTTINPTIIDVTSKQRHTSELSRLDCKLRLKDILDVGKLLKKTKCLRHKRNADYGTLQPIDEASLDELRKTYKDSLKEITLKPDEDPTEALMRYNADSIREALEHANEQPMEVHADDAHCEHEVTILDQREHTPKRIPNDPHMYNHVRHGHYEAMGTQGQHPNSAHYQNKFQETKHDNRKETLSAAINASSIALSSKITASDEARSLMSSLPESELQAVMELIKQQMQTCCDACRDRILSNIKTNIQNANASEATTTKPSCPKAEPIDDAQFEKWLREMELKGYDSKYLTKSHYWEYLNSGKLILTVESDEDASAQAQSDNKIAKKSLEPSQTFKRYTESNALLKSVESKTQHTKVDITNRARGKAFERKAPVLNQALRDNAHVVNDELQHLKAYPADEVDHTPSPYSLRGKFKHSKKRNTDITPLSSPVKFNAMTRESSNSNRNKNNMDTNTDKVVELLSLLYDLGPTVKTENGKPTQLSVMVVPFVETTTAHPEQPNLTVSTSNNESNTQTGDRSRTKRLRLKRKKVVHVTSTDQATTV